MCRAERQAGKGREAGSEEPECEGFRLALS